MTTIHDLPSDQASLMDTLNLLASKGVIRQLDYQFARFIYAQFNHDQGEQHARGQALAFIAGVVSSELGKGHICLPLFDAQGQPTDFASKVTGWAKLFKFFRVALKVSGAM